jgi:hypothetical protein
LTESIAEMGRQSSKRFWKTLFQIWIQPTLLCKTRKCSVPPSLLHFNWWQAFSQLILLLKLNQ